MCSIPLSTEFSLVAKMLELDCGPTASNLALLLTCLTSAYSLQSAVCVYRKTGLAYSLGLEERRFTKSRRLMGLICEVEPLPLVIPMDFSEPLPVIFSHLHDLTPGSAPKSFGVCKCGGRSVLACMGYHDSKFAQNRDL